MKWGGRRQNLNVSENQKKRRTLSGMSFFLWNKKNKLEWKKAKISKINFRANQKPWLKKKKKKSTPLAALNSSLSMFIESCEVQMSGAIVGMLQYLIQSLQKHAQNMSIQPIHWMGKKKKEKKSPKFFFKVEFYSYCLTRREHHCQECICFVFFLKEKKKKRCSNPERAKWKWVLQ